MQSRLIDPSDHSAYLIFGDGAGAAIISSGTSGHRIHHVQLGVRHPRPAHGPPRRAGLRRAQRPWRRRPVDSHRRPGDVPFRHRKLHQYHPRSDRKSGWSDDETRWIIPHQANGRILKAAAKRSGLPFDRFFLNIERVGNTSSASIPLALVEAEESLQPGDKLILCSVGAGMTTAAISVEW